jgi:hypothetical protein
MFLMPSQNDIEKLKMTLKANTDLVYEFIDNLSAEQLFALYLMLVNMKNMKVVATQYGLVMGQLRLKHHACFCGERSGFHTEIDHFTAAPDTSTPVESEQQVTPSAEILDPVEGSEEYHYNPRTWSEQDANLPDEVYQHINSVLDQYKLTIVSIEGSPEGRGQYMCRRCSSIYQSLTDRMLKGPDDCAGCHHLEAHGGITPW